MPTKKDNDILDVVSHPKKDLTRLAPANWPTNRVFRSVVNVQVRDLELLKHQMADFVTLPEGTILEGLDIVPTQPLDRLVKLQAETISGGVIGSFILQGDSMERVEPIDGTAPLAEGTLIRQGHIVLRNIGSDIDSRFTGRLAFVFKGYTLEHWR